MADEQEAVPFDAADPAAEDNARRDEVRRDREDADVYRVIMHTKNGRAWLYRRLERGHIYGSTFAPGQPDLTAFQLGEENYAKRIMLEAQAASVDLYMTMIKEAQAEERRAAETRRKEQRSRERDEAPPDPEEMVGHLPPPAGFPGHKPPAKPKK